MNRLLAARAAAAMLLVGALASWAGALSRGEDQLANKDWVWFHRVGAAWWSGDIGQIYRSTLDTHHPFVHPPFFIWCCVPFGGAPADWTTFAAFTLVSTALCVAAVSLVAGALRAAPGRRSVAVLAVLASGTWLGGMITGQVSALHLLPAAAGLAAWSAGRPLLAGLCLSLLAIKPQLLLPLVVFAVLARRWRLALGAGLGAALLAACSLPLGLELWRDYLESTRHVAQVLATDSLTLGKQRTLMASLSWITGQPPTSALVLSLWAVIVLPLAWAVIRVWRDDRPELLPRRLGIAMLFLVAAAPYLFFYDALLLAIPALVLWLAPESYAGRRSRAACAVLLGLVYASEYLNLVVLGAGLPPFMGLLVTGWLAIELRDVRARCS